MSNPTPTRDWSHMTAEEHITEAGRLLDRLAAVSETSMVNGLHGDMIRAQAHMTAADVLTRSTR